MKKAAISQIGHDSDIQRDFLPWIPSRRLFFSTREGAGRDGQAHGTARTDARKSWGRWKKENCDLLKELVTHVVLLPCPSFYISLT